LVRFQLFREELERVVGDSLRESGSEGISALISDVMNIKTGSKFTSSSFLKKQSVEISGQIFFFIMLLCCSLFIAFRQFQMKIIIKIPVLAFSVDILVLKIS